MATIEVLTPYVEKVVQQVLGLEHLHRDDDGDIAVPLDRTTMYIRMADGPNGHPRVALFGPFLKDVEATPGLYIKMNDLNRDAAYLRFYLVDAIVWGSMEIVAESVRPEDLANGLAAAEFYSAHLAKMLGIPDTPWRDSPPSAARNRGDLSEAPANVGSALEQELTHSVGPAAHATVTSGNLPNDPSSADLRAGYL